MPQDSHDDPRDDALLDAALRAEVLMAEALEGGFEAERLELLDGTAPALSPAARARALAAFEEVGAEELLADALEGDSEALWVAAASGTGPLDARVRRAALEAFDRADDPAPVLSFEAAASVLPRGPRAGRRVPGDEPLRARRMAPLLGARGLAAAAVLLVAVGASVALLLGGRHAEAGLQLRALGRIDRAGAVRMSQVEPRYFAELGHVFTPARDELLSFDLADDALVVVGEGDAVRVVRAAQAQAAGLPASAVLRLEAGEARLATRGHPVPLQIDGVGLLVLSEGAAHVAIDASAGTPAVALAERSVARFHRADGRSVPLTGPTRVLLSAAGPTAFGAPARSLFEELRLFGGPLPAPRLVRAVAARQFEPVSGPVRRRGHVMQVLAGAKPGEAEAALVWQAPPAVATATSLEVRLRAPAGTRVGLGEAEAVVARDGLGAEPGTASVTLQLAPGWYERLVRGRLQLTVRVPGAPEAPDAPDATHAPHARIDAVRAWFDGVALVFDPDASQEGPSRDPAD